MVPVDPIIDPALFDAVQAALRARNPKAMPPRVVSGPILLTGLATCASCGGGMTLRTGKSGRYRYYTCATCAQRGKEACKGRSVPMAKLDDAVTESLAEHLLTPERVGRLLAGLMDRQTARDADHAQRLAALRDKLADAESRLDRLYQAIENGIADPSDATLKERIAAFTRVMRENVRSGAIPFRRAYIRAVVDQVEVDDTEIRIHGRRTVLERLVMGGGASPVGVPSFVRKWRAIQDKSANTYVIEIKR